MSTKEVLDKGYVRLVNHMGSDLTVVNAARVSYAKESKELSEKDRRLIKFLAREGHTSPFRHVIV
jgi:thymidylate synthase (FAD)